MKRTITLYRGTNVKELSELLNGKYNDLSWWTDNLQNIGHYYEGACVVLTLDLDDIKEMEYIQQKGLCYNSSEYTYGKAEMNCPRDSTWYSINGNYIKDNLLSVKELAVYIGEEDEDGYEPVFLA